MRSANPAPLLEVCVDDARGLAAAIAGGADRVELCAALPLGGLTPGPGLIALAAQTDIPVIAMIRPRAGGFRHGPDEIAAALADIAAVRAAGLRGVVTGATLPDGRLDVETLSTLRDAAGALEFAVHRAFDLAPDPAEALEQAIALGACRVLTSGGTRSAPEGAAMLSRLALQAGNRITIMAGGGVRPENAAMLLRTGVHDLHASCSSLVTDDPLVARIGIAADRPVTLAENVVALRSAMLRAHEEAS